MKILAMGIHPDDVELGCGGTVILAAELGHEVTVIDLSDGSAASNGSVADRAREAAKAAKIMGVERRLNLELPDAHIRTEDTDQLRTVVAAIREVRPEVMLLPSSDDPHPDHALGGELLKHAVYFAGLRGYEPERPAWSVRYAMIYAGRIEFVPDVIVDVATTFKKKMDAIQAHETQFIPGGSRQPTPLNSPGFLASIEARGRLFGQKINAEFGEPFRLLGPLALGDFKVFEA